MRITVSAILFLCCLSFGTCFINGRNYSGDVLIDEANPPIFEINMDLPPRERYAEVAAYYNSTMAQFEQYLIKNLTDWTGVPFLGNIATGVGYLVGLLYPHQEVIEELDAWIDLFKVNRGLVYLLNIMYEATAFSRKDLPINNGTGFFKNLKMCTGILATNLEGETIHGRNFDFAFE